jgi:hypothetical protein
VADGDPERRAVDHEQTPSVAGSIRPLLLGGELVLGLAALHPAVGVDEGEVEQPVGA